MTHRQVPVSSCRQVIDERLAKVISQIDWYAAYVTQLRYIAESPSGEHFDNTPLLVFEVALPAYGTHAAILFEVRKCRGLLKESIFDDGVTFTHERDRVVMGIQRAGGDPDFVYGREIRIRSVTTASLNENLMHSCLTDD